MWNRFCAVTSYCDPSSTVTWFANSVGGVALGSGTSFNTPSISSTTTYYASATNGFTSASFGLTDRVGSTTNSGYSDIGLMFDAAAPFTLNSVAVYPVATTPSGNATTTIALKDAAGTILQSATVSLPTSTNPGIKTVVPLNFTIPATGSNYRLVFTSASGGGLTGFIREASTGYTYPYTYPGVASITSAYTSGASSIYYYYFYDWQISVGCESPRQPVVATVNSSPSISATISNATICQGITTNLNVTSANDPNYTYTWQPGNLSGPAQTVSPLSNTVYTVTAVDNTSGAYAGCADVATLSVVVNPAPALAASASVNSFPCGGGSSTLTAVSEVNYQSGTGTTLVSGNALTPYSHFYEGQRTQYLILASELIAAGVGAGPMNSLTFNVVAKNSTSNAYNTAGDFKNYTIKMAHSSSTNLSSADATLVGSYTTVWGPTNYITTAGNNTHSFSTPFVWDGVNNLVISVCFENDPTGGGIAYTTNDHVNGTTTPATMVRGYYQDNSNTCGNTAGTVATSLVRPNMTILTNAGTSFVWQPGGLTGSPVNVTPTTTTAYTVTATGMNGCTSTSVLNISVAPCTATVTTNFMIQGYYDVNTSAMQPVLLNSNGVGSSLEADNVTVELHDATPPYALAHTFSGVLGINGQIVCTFPAAAVGNSYYIVLKGRNSIETWSAAPVLMATSTSYDFTTAATQAYSSNQIDVSGSGLYAIYNGDVNQDGVIDGLDFNDWETDNNNFAAGYITSDFNGDGIVDGLDFLIWEPNNNNFVGMITP
ncbi:MAG: hypothetical protein HWD58_04505 [Bacteroidota bacterium]|nr:MAG: hypothetical protein HWD58_04505 [Bacteroidota bacterium]